jgi:phospholipase/carboxylesterase
MSYALGLGADRPKPAGILAMSGFLPTVDGWEPSLQDRTAVRAFVTHGTGDPVIDVRFARAARDLLRGAGLPVEYHESPSAHHIDPRVLPLISDWVATTL